MLFSSGSLDLEGLITTYALYRLAMREILSIENQNLQAILCEKQPDITLAMIHWINNAQKSIIKPTWRNLFLVLLFISPDELDRTIFIGAPMERGVSSVGTKVEEGNLTSACIKFYDSSMSIVLPLSLIHI